MAAAARLRREQVWCSQARARATSSEGLVNCSCAAASIRRWMSPTAAAFACTGNAAGATCQSGRCMGCVVADCKDRLNPDHRRLRRSVQDGAALRPADQKRRHPARWGQTCSLLCCWGGGFQRCHAGVCHHRRSHHTGEVFAGTYDISYQPSVYWVRPGGAALPAGPATLRCRP